MKPRSIVPDFPQKAATPVVLAPLNAATADEFIEALLNTGQKCVLIAPLIFHCAYFHKLRQKYKYFISSYKNIFPHSEYTGFRAAVFSLC